jgi:hypothetical protein
VWVGSKLVEVEPSPKFQAHLVIFVEWVEVSLNLTVELEIDV